MESLKRAEERVSETAERLIKNKLINFRCVMCQSFSDNLECKREGNIVFGFLTCKKCNKTVKVQFTTIIEVLR